MVNEERKTRSISIFAEEYGIITTAKADLLKQNPTQSAVSSSVAVVLHNFFEELKTLRTENLALRAQVASLQKAN